MIHNRSSACLTGHINEHARVFLLGTGSNGKSVFVTTVTGILGDYAVSAPMEMCIATQFDRHPTEIAKLMGATAESFTRRNG
jgi:putative DNA primase/helicase